MRIIFALVFCFVAGSAIAQNTGRVRAIEHPNFSRLVFDIAPSTTWNSHQTGRETTLVLNGVKSRFDSTSLFDRMSRSRILNFGQSAGTQGLNVTIELGCDCEVTIDRLSGNQLAFDVWRQGSRPTKARTEVSEQEVDSQTPALPPLTANNAVEADSTPETSDTEEDLRLAASIAEEARQLEEEIARIAQEGFLELDPQGSKSPDNMATKLTHTEEDIYSGPDIPLTAPTHRSEIPFTDNGNQTRIGSTLLDADVETSSATSREPSPAECNLYRVGSQDEIMQDVPVSDHLSSYRAKLINVDGSLNEAAWRKLARYYVAIGFGAEAIAVLNELPNRDDPDVVMADLARIVEDVRPAGSLLINEDYCSVELGIWRLASGRVPQEFDQQDVLRELAMLPYAIRKSIGLMISGHVEQDFPEFAETVHNLIERTPDTEVPLSQEEIVQELAEEAMQSSSQGSNARVETATALPSTNHEPTAEVTESDDLQEKPTLRPGDPNVELDLSIAARQLSGTAPGLTATLTLAKYEAETGNILDAVTLLNEALLEYEFGSVEIYQTGTDVLLESSQVPEFKTQFILAALAGRKFLLVEEHQKTVEARIAELGLPNLRLF